MIEAGFYTIAVICFILFIRQVYFHKPYRSERQMKMKGSYHKPKPEDIEYFRQRDREFNERINHTE